MSREFRIVQPGRERGLWGDLPGGDRKRGEAAGKGLESQDRGNSFPLPGNGIKGGWKGLAGAGSALDVSRARLEHPGAGKVSLLITGWDWMGFRVPSHPTLPWFRGLVCCGSCQKGGGLNEPHKGDPEGISKPGVSKGTV